jgi:hypothetical protein
LALPGAATGEAAIPPDDALIDAFAAFPLSNASVEVNAHGDSIIVESREFGDFPVAGDDYIIMSTGDASDVFGGPWQELASTSLGTENGADGNDLTQLTFDLEPPAGAECFSFDFQFLVEGDRHVSGVPVADPYSPDIRPLHLVYVWDVIGSRYNDIFTAELNESFFSMEEGQVVAPNNFAYDSDGNMVSINTVAGLYPLEWSYFRLNFRTDRMTAMSPIEADIDTGRMSLILSIQDVASSYLDSAVLLDNLRWWYDNRAGRCDRAVYPTSDRDGDGLPDEWEVNGIDYDGDGVPELDLPAMGADMRHADIFLEIDWMVKPGNCIGTMCWGGWSFAPDQDALDDVVAAFAAAPYRNPDGTQGISLHVDAGEHSPPGQFETGASGSAVPWQEHFGTITADGYDWADFEAVKAAHFGPDGSDARRDAFHYVVYADRWGDSESSGISRGIPGADLIISDGPWVSAWPWKNGFQRHQESGTLMHELGHNLGLQHGGPDGHRFQWDPAYLSIMNYTYQMDGVPPDDRVDYSRGEPFDDWAHIRFDGGSIGDFGDEAPVMVTPDVDELTWDTANDWGAAGAPGDGELGFLGPNLFAVGRADQVLYVWVTNVSAEEATYHVAAAVGDTPTASVEVTVAGRSSVIVPVTFTAAGLGAGEVALELTLSSDPLGPGVDRVSETLLGLDLDAPGVREDLAEAAAGARAHAEPPHELVPAAVDRMVEVAAGSPGDPPEDLPSEGETEPAEEPSGQGPGTEPGEDAEELPPPSDGPAPGGDEAEPVEGPGGDGSPPDDPDAEGIPSAGDGAVGPAPTANSSADQQGRPGGATGVPSSPARADRATPDRADEGGGLPVTGAAGSSRFVGVGALMVVTGVLCLARSRRSEHGAHSR